MKWLRIISYFILFSYLSYFLYITIPYLYNEVRHLYNEIAYLPENRKELVRPKIFSIENIDDYFERSVNIDIVDKDIYKMCSGVIIDSNFVLTARHCIEGLIRQWMDNTDNYILVNKDTITLRVENIIFYNQTSPQSLLLEKLDMAILKLESPGFPFSYYTPALSMTDTLAPGMDLFWFSYGIEDIIDNGIHFGNVNKEIQYYEFGNIYYQADGVVIHGMSGSGVYTLDGKLTGLVVEVFPEYNTRGFINNIGTVILPIGYLNFLIKNPTIIDLPIVQK